MIILGACIEPAILSVMKIINIFIFIIKILAPIILIIMIAYDLVKAILYEEKIDFKSLFKSSMIKFVMAIVIFFTPTLSSTVLDMINIDNKYLSCLTLRLISDEEIDNAYIAKADKLITKAEETELISDYHSAKNIVGLVKNETEKKDLENRLSKLYEIIEEKNKDSINVNDGNTKIVKGTYISPIMGLTGFGSINDTFCTYSNSVKSILHDVGASTGTSIYASFDGTAKFYQVYCSTAKGNLLWSYGNKIIIDGNNGEGIVMAHFSAFVINGQKTTGNITRTCHDVYSSCGAGKCPSGTISKLVGTANVKAGDLIGYSGNTGNSDGPHLHVELKDPINGGCVVDPWHTYFGY